MTDKNRPKTPKTQVNKKDKDAERFRQDLIERGEAAHPDDKGELPPGATHEIVSENAEGVQEIKRRRFSIC
jgi:hypothetical protein